MARSTAIVTSGSGNAPWGDVTRMADGHPLCVALVTADADRRAQLRTAVESDVRLKVMDADPREAPTVAVMARRGRVRPDVVVVDVPCGLGDDLAVISALASVSGAPAVLAVVAEEVLDFSLDALMAGASGILTRSAARDALPRVVTQVAAGEAVVSPDVTTALVRRLQSQSVG